MIHNLLGEVKYEKQIIGILVCMLLVTASTILLVVPEKLSVEAISGDGSKSGDNEDLGLDTDFVWNVTVDLANVVHDAYSGDDIRKGRAFGTKGEHSAALIN
jgi:hypothetical protein